jgi:hypothetical protein
MPTRTLSPLTSTIVIRISLPMTMTSSLSRLNTKMAHLLVVSKTLRPTVGLT